MIWQYSYTPNIWPAIGAAVFMAALGLYSWGRRSVPGARPFALACLFGVLWLAGIAGEAAAATIPAKITWFKFQAAWQLPSVTAITFFVLEYVYPRRWLNRRNVLLLSIPPLLRLGLILTNDLHHILWLGFSYDGTLRALNGVGNLIQLGYGLSLVLINLVAFLWLFIHSPQHRWPVALMVVGQIIARALFMLDFATSGWPAPLDPLILALLIPFGIYVVALFGFRIFDPLPAAHKLVIKQMDEGVVVLDAGWRVVSLNPAAERVLDIPLSRARHRAIQELWPISRTLELHPDELQATSQEISLGEGADARHYVAVLSALRDRGLVIGYLLLLQDITERRQAQARILAQQWAQATLQERGLLAQELHDGLSQNLAFLNLQAQAAQVYLHGDQRAAALESLAALVKASLEIQGAMRELIGNLLAVSLPSEGFCNALRGLLARFEGQTDMRVNLQIGSTAEKICDPSSLPPMAGVHLLRIVQEALANVHKHAGNPSRVDVRLNADGGMINLTVEDNGAGFNMVSPAQTGNHFGLQVMRRRAAHIGGQVAVHSALGQGTRVEVCLPVDKIPAQAAT